MSAVSSAQPRSRKALVRLAGGFLAVSAAVAGVAASGAAIASPMAHGPSSSHGNKHGGALDALAGGMQRPLPVRGML